MVGDTLSLVLVLRLKPVRLGNEVKSNWASVPANSGSERFIRDFSRGITSNAFLVAEIPNDELREEDERGI